MHSACGQHCGESPRTRPKHKPPSFVKPSAEKLGKEKIFPDQALASTRPKYAMAPRSSVRKAAQCVQVFGIRRRSEASGSRRKPLQAWANAAHPALGPGAGGTRARGPAVGMHLVDERHHGLGRRELGDPVAEVEDMAMARGGRTVGVE